MFIHGFQKVIRIINFYEFEETKRLKWSVSGKTKKQMQEANIILPMGLNVTTTSFTAYKTIYKLLI